MAIVQISKMQQRAGNLVDLPQLDNGELGWAADANRLFIGRSGTTSTSENIEVLTSYSAISLSQITGSDSGNLNITAAENGQLLTYVSSTDTWENYTGNSSQLSGGKLQLGDVANLVMDGGASGYVLQTDGLGNLTWTAQTGGSGGGGAGGSNTTVQFNDSGLPNGVAAFTFNKNSNTLTVSTGNIFTNNVYASSSMGVGTSSLSYKFQVEGGRALITPSSEAYAVGVRYNSSTNGVWLGSPSANAFQISNFGGTAYVNIDNSGNVGIGNSSPTHKLSVTGTTNISGNANVGNLGSAGIISATGNVSGGNLSTGGSLSVTGNANIGNLGTAQVLASANVIAPQLISNVATGTAPFVVSSNTVVANLNADLLDGYTTSSANTANTIALRDASGNISANYFIGNGSQLTGLSTSSLSNGNSNVSIPAANGNVNISSAGNANILVVTGSGVVASSLTVGIGTIDPSAKIQVFDGAIMPATGQGLNNGILFPPNPGGGSGDYAWIRHYAYTPGQEFTVLEIGTGNDLTDNIAFMPTGNVGIGTVSPSSRFHVANGSANISGSITVNSDAGATAIINGAGNAIGNIGSSTKYFNTVFAQATSALYADLAEMYVSDAEYAPGTVLEFGGQQEVTLSTTDSSRRVAGVVSTNPAHIMNSGLEAEHSVAVALTGRVPTLVIGSVTKGDMMVSAGTGRARAEENPVLGSVIGKALENFNGTEGVIEIVVGRL
jgi:hypothetical protein